jgi:hypothetical protein
MKIMRDDFVLSHNFDCTVKIGRNIITRRDTASALTQPWTKSLKELKSGPAATADADFCGCGTISKAKKCRNIFSFL